MCSRFLSFSSLLLLAALPCLAEGTSIFRVCADPNNLPFSNEAGQGFENKLAELIAAKLNAKLEYTWWSQRKSFVKNSLDEGKCDVLMGVPSALDSVSVTRPYYRSTYVFVTRHDRNLHITSLTDERLSQLRIGIHVVGDDYAPPAFALARRGITQNIVGFSLFGEYGEANPARKVIDAVEHGEVDVAIAWGPFAGYFSQTVKTPLDIQPVSPPTFLGIPFTYDMSVGVHKGNEELKEKLNDALQSESAGVRQILLQYGIPLVH
ncbi:MAG: substrate-binding domain-containing protein [Acidobacteriaceae bacterium]|nr:substrate-binding domain-containing protein [Acidobacteriaceae bacterium]